MRKANANNKPDRALTPEQRAAVDTWLDKDGLSFREAAERCHAEFGVSISATALWRFYHRSDDARLSKKLFASGDLTNQILTECENQPGDAFHAMTELLGRLALLQANKEDNGQSEDKVDWKVVATMFQAAVAGRKQMTAEEAETRATRELELKLTQYQDKVAEQKAAIEAACAGARTEGLSPETLKRIEEAAALL
jgi:hypothetical protein